MAAPHAASLIRRPATCAPRARPTSATRGRPPDRRPMAPPKSRSSRRSDGAPRLPISGRERARTSASLRHTAERSMGRSTSSMARSMEHSTPPSTEPVRPFCRRPRSSTAQHLRRTEPLLAELLTLDVVRRHRPSICAERRRMPSPSSGVAVAAPSCGPCRRRSRTARWRPHLLRRGPNEKICRRRRLQVPTKHRPVRWYD